MAKRKIKDVAKFGGVDQLGQVTTDLHSDIGGKHNVYDASNVEAKSEKTHLEDDKGEGNAVVIRRFTFQMNLEHPELFIERRPGKQEIFNSHTSGIEMALWKDGLNLFLEVQPRITFDEKKFQYSIFVAAKPSRGQTLQERPQTLSEVANG